MHNLFGSGIFATQGLKTDNNKTTRFEINDVIIEENLQYHTIQATIETLSDNEKPEEDKYFYHAIFTLISNGTLQQII